MALAEFDAKTNEIRAKKQEISASIARLAEKEEHRLEKDRVLQHERKKAGQNSIRKDRIKNLNELQVLQRQSDLMRQTAVELEQEVISIAQEIESIRAEIESSEVELKMVQEVFLPARNIERLRNRLQSSRNCIAQ